MIAKPAGRFSHVMQIFSCLQTKIFNFFHNFKECAVGSLSSATFPPIYMQFTGQGNGGTAS